VTICSTGPKISGDTGHATQHDIDRMFV